ncbi:GNAT family N-acetyltransferase [Thiobacillus denitrificans]|nr:GNAT family N-acetyltransferase [Thiobacillus denitrificans]
MQIRAAEARDYPAIVEILLPVMREGGTYAIDPALRADEALGYWTSADKESFVAEDEGGIVGTYYLRPNQAGGGRHVCNCGYVTRAEARGRGVARAMCEHSLAYAASRGYRAMQFNFVVSTNTHAVRLWQALGFEIVGRIPEAFCHPEHAYVDAFVMHRFL